MDATIEPLQALLAREHIRELLARLARGEDRRDAELIRASYWPDARVDYGLFEGDFAAYLDWVVPGSPAVPVTQHVLGQSLINLTKQVALVETHVLAYHRIKTGETDRDTILGGRYLDRIEQRASEWRIASRTMLYDWSQDVGAAADWSNGVMGLPFSAGHYSGRAVGDFSETFFGKRAAAR